MLPLESGYPALPFADQFFWLSLAAWCAMLAWLWPRALRRRVVPWLILAVSLHIVPLIGQLLPLIVPGKAREADLPWLFWGLHALNGVAFGVILWIGWALRRPVRRASQTAEVLAERRRIANDLHDGVGSRLVALLATQDSPVGRSGGFALSSTSSTSSTFEEAAAKDALLLALQACLLELHMTVDALDDEPDATLAERLGHLRYRLQPAFDRLGIALEWQVCDVVLVQPLTGDAAVGICRIVQEALSNALRHSHATRVQVRCSSHARTHGLVLEVRDNGRGFGLGVTGTVDNAYLGKGLGSMRSRAQAMQGELRVLNVAPSGLSVQLLLPHHQLATPQRPTCDAGL